jgi:hypothetical protein
MALLNDDGTEEETITSEDIDNAAQPTTISSTYVPTEVVDGQVIPDRHFTNGGVIQ